MVLYSFLLNSIYTKIPFFNTLTFYMIIYNRKRTILKLGLPQEQGFLFYHKNLITIPNKKE